MHSHLVRQRLRTFTSLNVRSAECLDAHYFAVLIGVGATTVNAYLAQETIADRHARGLFGELDARASASPAIKKAIDEGLLKIISKMGISVISSYRGGYNFEARRPVALAGRRVLPRHALAHLRHRPGRHRSEARRAARSAPSTRTSIALPIGGFYKLPRAAARRHAFEAQLIHMLQDAVATDSPTRPISNYTRGDARRCRRSSCATCWTSSRPRSRCRSTRSRSITEIRKRFVTPGMSLGALGAGGARDAERSP